MMTQMRRPVVALCVALLCVVAAFADTTMTWKSTSSTDMNNVANYACDPAAPSAIDANCILRFIDSAGITEANATATGAVSANEIHVFTASPYNWSMATKAFTVVSAFEDTGGGTQTMNGSLTISGTGHIYLKSGTMSSLTLTFNGAYDSLWFSATGATIKSWTAAAGTYFYRGGSGSIAYTVSNGPPLLTLGNGATYEEVGGSASYNLNANGAFWSVGTGCTIKGTSQLLFATSANSVHGTLPALTYTGSGAITTYLSNAYSGDTIEYTGNVDWGRNSLSAQNTRASPGALTYIVGTGDTVRCGTFAWGTTNATGTSKYVLNGGVLRTRAATETSTGTDSMYRGTSAWYDSAGNWTYAAPSGNDIIDQGTSKQVFRGDANITVSTTNHTAGFWKVIDTVGTGYKLSLADSITADSILVHGGFKSATFNLSKLLYFEIDSKADPCSLGTGVMSFTQPHALFYYKSGMPRDMKRLSLNFTAGLQIKSDTSELMTFYRVKDGALNDTLTLPATDTIRDSTYTAGDLDSVWIMSSSAGNQASFRIPAAGVVSANTRFKDVKVTGGTWVDTGKTKGLNFGNTSGILFADTLHQYYKTPTSITVSSRSPTVVPTTGGTTVNVVGTGYYTPCTWAVEGTAQAWAPVTDSSHLSFVTGAHAAGTFSVYIVNADGKTATTSLEYRAKPAISYAGTPFSLTKDAAMTPATVTNSGGTADSFTVAPALPSALSLNKTSGTISGTPGANQVATPYCVKAWGLGGNDSDTVSIEVTTSGPTKPDIALDSVDCTYWVGTAITKNKITNTGGAIATVSWYHLADDPVIGWPAGITMDTTGYSGTPTALMYSDSSTYWGEQYGIIATNAAGSDTVLTKFYIKQVVKIDSIRPDTATPGATVTIYGSGLGWVGAEGTVTVGISGVTPTMTKTNQRMTFVAPDTANGKYQVKYVNNFTTADSDSVTILELPVLTTLKHPMGRVGYVDTIVGSKFGASGGSATFIGGAVTISHQTDDTLIWPVPTGDRGTGNWIYTRSDGGSDTVTFRRLVPSITIINP